MFPSLPDLPGGFNNPFISNVPGNTTPGVMINSPSWGDILGGLGGILQNPGGAISNTAGQAGAQAGNALGSIIGGSLLGGLDLLRILLFVIGLIAIIGAIYLYKPVNEAVNEYAKETVSNAKVAATAAVAA